MLLTMSISGGILIILIIVLRFFAINKLPKKVFVLLWDIVLLRLLIPFNLPISYGIASPAAKMIDNGIILYNVSYPPITQGNTKKLIVEIRNYFVLFFIRPASWKVGLFTSKKYLKKIKYGIDVPSFQS